MAAAALSMTTSLASGQAVAPSRVTPSTLAPPAGPSGAITLSSPAGLAAPPNAAKLSVSISNVTVEGGFPELAADTAAITAKLRGGRTSVAQIFAAANAIEQAYAARGYVLVRVAVPPQQLKNGGTLRLVVIDGFVEGVDVKGVPERQRALVQARLASLIGKRHVTLGEIERRLILASDVPGLVLSSTIARGAEAGGTLLVLEATHNIVAGTVGVDNRLPASLGNWELNGALAINSPFGYGEQLYGAASTGYNLGKVFDATTPMQLLGVGAVLPIGVDGFKINPEYTNSVTRPAPFPGAPPDVGYYQRFDLRASYPLILTRAQALTFQATYEWAQEHLSPIGFDTDIYDDQYNVARLQLEDHLRLPAGLLAGTFVFSQGLGGRGETQAVLTGVPLSQQGVVPDLQQARSRRDLDAAPALRFARRSYRSGADELRPSAVHCGAVFARWAPGRLRLSARHVQRRRGRDAARRAPAPLPARLGAGADDRLALYLRRRFARLDRRPDAGAAGAHQRRVVWRWPASWRGRCGDGLSARSDVHHRTRSRFLERRRRGTSVSRQCRLRREFLRFALSMFKRG